MFVIAVVYGKGLQKMNIPSKTGTHWLRNVNVRICLFRKLERDGSDMIRVPSPLLKVRRSVPDHPPLSMGA